jgi:hypothetical protein
MALSDQHLQELAPSLQQRVKLRRRFVGSGRGVGRTASATCAMTPASSASVFANGPVALAKSRP